ncbi:MAG: hypothetical protein WBC55_10270 [Dehalococcoidia bacterium]
MQENRVRAKLFGEYLEELGVCTSEQVKNALDYCTACSRKSTYVSIGQALIELGYATQHKIDQVLQMQAKDRLTMTEGTAKASEQAPASEQTRTEVDEEVDESERVQLEAAEGAVELDIFTAEQAEGLGIFTSEQVQDALEHCGECCESQRYLSLGQALVELGYATRDEINVILRLQAEQGDPAYGESIARIMEVMVDAQKLSELGEQAKELGICTSEQLEDALGYYADCAKRRRYISLAQALVELGHTTQDKIGEIIETTYEGQEE